MVLSARDACSLVEPFPGVAGFGEITFAALRTPPRRGSYVHTLFVWPLRATPLISACAHCCCPHFACIVEHRLGMYVLLRLARRLLLPVFRLRMPSWLSVAVGVAHCRAVTVVVSCFGVRPGIQMWQYQFAVVGACTRHFVYGTTAPPGSRLCARAVSYRVSRSFARVADLYCVLYPAPSSMPSASKRSCHSGNHEECEAMPTHALLCFPT